MASSMVHIRVNVEVKEQAAEALATMGLTVSDAVRILLTRIAAEKAMPFEVRVPNRETVEAMEAGDRYAHGMDLAPEALRLRELRKERRAS